MLACACFAALDAGVASAQATRRSRLVEGRVQRPPRSASGPPVAVAGQWVVLHRVGSDRSAPLDSVKSDRSGRFRFRYSPSGDPDALYFVSAKHDGIAYFSPPLRGEAVRGGDADVLVYDTTTDTTPLRVQGRHLVVSAPRGNKREIAEVFEIENQGTTTVVARDTVTPNWSTPLPAAAENASVAPGDLSSGAVAVRNGRAEVYAPISPGVRQLVLTYLLPAKSFPLAQPVGRALSVLEVLLEEPRATVKGAKLAEVAPVSIDGRMFRRFLAQDVPASAIMRVSAPPPIEQDRSAMRVLAIVIGLLMLGAISVWMVKRRGTLDARRWTSDVKPQTSNVERLVAELATLDAQFERNGSKSADARTEYERRRAELKDRIVSTLASQAAPNIFSSST